LFVSIGILKSQFFIIGTTQKEFKDYFDENIADLDPLEGFWVMTYTQKNYTDGVFEGEESFDMEVVLVKRDDGTFKEYIMESNVCDRIGGNDGEFSTTLEKGTYSKKYLMELKPLIYGTKVITLMGNDFTFSTRMRLAPGELNKEIIMNTREIWRKLYPKND